MNKIIIGLAICCVLAFVGCAQNEQSQDFSQESFEEINQPEQQQILPQDLLPLTEIMLEFENIPIDYEVLGLESKQKELETHYVYNEKLYCSIIEMVGQGMLLNTDALLIYDIQSQTYETIKNPDPQKKRIWDFAIFGNALYYITVEFDETDLYAEGVIWKLYKSNTDFSESTLLVQGITDSPFVSPEFEIYNDELFIATLDKVSSKWVGKVSKINGETVETIFELDGDEERISDFVKIKFDDNKIYYMSFYENMQYLKCFDMTNKQFETLYSVDSNDGKLTGFEKTDDFIYISLQKKDSSGEVRLVKEKGNLTFNYSSLPTSEYLVLGDKVSAKSDKNIILFDQNGELAIEQLSEQQPNILPHYIYYDENSLIVQDMMGELFFLNIVA